MARTISTSGTLGITLTAGDNPVTILTTGTIDTGTDAYALLGPSGAYTITNSGLVRDTAAGGIGIGLNAGGTVTNAVSTAQITGVSYGIKVSGAPGYVTNSGTIQVNGGNIAHYAPAIALLDGGTVSNVTGGVITGGTNASGISATSSISVVNAGTITAGQGIVLTGGGGVYNSFVIQASYADAIDANASASITNAGRITGYNFGIELKGGGSIANNGTMNGANFAGIYAAGAFSISNTNTISAGQEGVLLASNATGLISNSNAGLIEGTADFGIKALGAATVFNQGQIVAPIQAVYMNAGGTLTNAPGGMIHGVSSFGVDIKGGAGTVVNHGNIRGGNYSVSLPSGFDNLLEEFPGAALNGLADGGNTIGSPHISTLYLASASSTGSLYYIGDSVVNFDSIVFAPNATWLASGNTDGIAGGEVFGDFQVGDTLQITGVANETIVSYGGGTLTLSGGANLSVQFSAPENVNFVVQNDSSNPSATDITLLLCFAEGTKILTPAGEVAIDDLREGDQVISALNEAAVPILWKGWRHVRPKQHREPERMCPVRIRAGAFGEGQPHTDLLVSPEHAIYVDGVLIPARLLVNGETIVRDDVAEITYYHLELPAHDVILAQGLACESYLNTGDRSAFANGGGAVALHPDFTALRWEGLACADLVLTGARLDRVRAGLAARLPRRAA